MHTTTWSAGEPREEDCFCFFKSGCQTTTFNMNAMTLKEENKIFTPQVWTELPSYETRSLSSSSSSSSKISILLSKFFHLFLTNSLKLHQSETYLNSTEGRCMKARTKKTGNSVHHAHVESQRDKNGGTKFLVSLLCKFQLVKLHQSHVRVFTQSLAVFALTSCN
jgi:hypothetical protein